MHIRNWYLIFIFMLSLVGLVSAAEPESVILANDQSSIILTNLLPFLSLIAVVFAAMIIIKIIMTMGSDN